MKSFRRLSLLAALLFIIIVLLWIWGARPAAVGSKVRADHSNKDLKSRPQIVETSQPTATVTESVRRKQAIDGIVEALGTPIRLFGVAVDEEGRPIGGASITYRTLDRFAAPGSTYSLQSDTNGRFEIGNVRGALLTVAVRKDGYYSIPGKSNGTFAYGLSPEGARQPALSPDAPAAFALRARGQAEALIHSVSHQINVPTGREIRIDAETGKPGSGDLLITSYVGQSVGDRFDWNCRVRVRDGGLIERKGPFDFQAPTDGYSSSVDVHMNSDSPSWSSSTSKEYFIRLADGRYARSKIEFFAGARTFVVLSTYLNPQSGSRNLEFDPAKQVKVGKR